MRVYSNATTGQNEFGRGGTRMKRIRQIGNYFLLFLIRVIRVYLRPILRESSAANVFRLKYF